jgi:putative acetyltransferase
MLVEVRNERPEDPAAIQQVHTEAFAGQVEAKLVRLISERHKALISLIAASDGKVVGHILFSRVTIANAPAAFNAVGLAPLLCCRSFKDNVSDHN